MIKYSIFSLIWQVRLALVWVGFFSLWTLPAHADARTVFQSTFESVGQANVTDENYKRGRQAAVNQAFRKAMEDALIDILGEDEFEANFKKLERILRKSRQFVRTYRFLEAFDDFDTQTSGVELEVTFFMDSLRKQLGALGVLANKGGGNAIIILVNEKSTASIEFASFWEMFPLSEAHLVEQFIASGINVVKRDLVRDSISEETVLSAARGDISAATDIGMAAGVDIVLVGNAVSTPRDGDNPGDQSVQVSLNLKAISSIKMRMVAAKSDFASAQAGSLEDAENQAFEIVANKLAGFFQTSIKNYWNPKPVAKSAPKITGSPQQTPSPPKPAVPALMEDL